MAGLHSGYCRVLYFCPACVEQWGRTDILAQASSPRLGKNSRSSPRVMLEAHVLVLSDTWSRSGEKVSPKRGLVKSPKAPVSSLA
ncbi:hypothetical protein DEO72_LG1g2090 [Vigna unguiculata]|uniref:Uncharacterized protein n=1 Tax=Vigna unguiculata TaxID=3917 RepID=A0A4D6KRW0_VIGUN|nr:hypothetical protein DEO72_LG1g2090 [Vigna unguiculata]